MSKIRTQFSNRDSTANKWSTPSTTTTGQVSPVHFNTMSSQRQWLPSDVDTTVTTGLPLPMTPLATGNTITTNNVNSKPAWQHITARGKAVIDTDVFGMRQRHLSPPKGTISRNVSGIQSFSGDSQTSRRSKSTEPFFQRVNGL